MSNPQPDVVDKTIRAQERTYWVLGAGIALLVIAWHLTVCTTTGAPLLQLQATAKVTGSLLRGLLGLPAVQTVRIPEATAATIWFLVYAGAGMALWVLVTHSVRTWQERREQNGLARAADMVKKNAAVNAGTGRLPFAYLDGEPIYDREEDTALVFAPSGQGKTTRVVLPWIWRVGAAPLISTSTKPDVLRLTAEFRSAFGNIRVYDPEGTTRWPSIKPDIVAGCEYDKVAAERARAIIAARPMDGDGEGKSSAFFTHAASVILRCHMHAAAITGQNFKAVMRWSRNLSVSEPYTILRDHPKANPGWLDDLEQYAAAEDAETRSNTQQSLSQFLAPFAIREILDSVCPEPGEGFDLMNFHNTTDTLYLLTESGGNSLAAPVITAVVETLLGEASRQATRTRLGRLSPRLYVAGDEIPSVCPIPSLPTRYADGRGRGIQFLCVAQGLDDMERRYGKSVTNSIFENASSFIQLGGSRNIDVLARVERLAGKIWRERRAASTGVAGVGMNASVEKDDALTVDRIAHVEEGQGLLLYRELRPAIVDLPASYEGEQAQIYADSEAWSLQQEGWAA